jgi:hypothetical protein
MAIKARRDPQTLELVATLDDFTRQYLVTALWSTSDDNDDPLDKNYEIEDIAFNSLAKAVRDCADFQERCRPALRDGFLDRRNYRGDSDAISLAGHDFWLTRNGAGAGFWDGDWVDPVGDMLSKIAKRYSSIDIYVGDDRRLHLTTA